MDFSLDLADNDMDMHVSRLAIQQCAWLLDHRHADLPGHPRIPDPRRPGRGLSPQHGAENPQSTAAQAVI
jgi:hypothetical protein